MGHPVYRFVRKVTLVEVDAFLGRCDAMIIAHGAIVPLGPGAGGPAPLLPLPAPGGGAPAPLAVTGFASMDFDKSEWVSIWSPKMLDDVGAVYSSDLVKASLPIVVWGVFVLI